MAHFVVCVLWSSKRTCNRKTGVPIPWGTKQILTLLFVSILLEKALITSNLTFRNKKQNRTPPDSSFESGKSQGSRLHKHSTSLPFLKAFVWWGTWRRLVSGSRYPPRSFLLIIFTMAWGIFHFAQTLISKTYTLYLKSGMVACLCKPSISGVRLSSSAQSSRSAWTLARLSQAE